MKVVALISGGKDSTYNMMQCVAAGHQIVALANLQPISNGELDSYMYQTVGHEGIEFIAKCMDLPLYRRTTEGKAEVVDKNYEPTNNDEVEDMYNLLQTIKSEIDFEAVAVGAILSDYQRIRVENVCSRLGLISLAYLWRRNQTELLNEMIECGIRAVIIKVAALGLEPTRHLGVPIGVMRPHLQRMKEKYGLNVCGEGGEYETFTLDCPLYSSTIVVDESETIIHSDDAIAPVGYLNFKKLRLVPKNVADTFTQRLEGLPIKTPLSFVTDIDLDDISNNDETIPNEVISNDFYKQPVDESTGVEHYVNYGPTVGGWFWIGELSGESDNPSEAMSLALEKLQNCLTEGGYTVKDVCAVTMYINDMDCYAELNRSYCKTFKYPNPPARVCVQCPLKNNVPVLLDALAYSKKKCIVKEGAEDGDCENKLVPSRINLHVQGISHWAPANIGPYSQALQVGDIVRVAGQIGMVPGTLELIKGGVLKQCRISLRHIGRIVSAFDPHMQLRDVVQGVCYVTDPSFIEIARNEWEKKTNNAIVDYLVVSYLPKGALIEWHLWAHKHNNQFEYEETGKCVDNYLLSIRRRFNYENKVAAVVCYVEHRLELNDSLNPDIILTSLEYALAKLNQDYNASGVQPLCNFRFFYPVNRGIRVEFIQNILKESHAKYNIVYTIVPVSRLQKANTLLSIVGVRYE